MPPYDALMNTALCFGLVSSILLACGGGNGSSDEGGDGGASGRGGHDGSSEGGVTPSSDAGDAGARMTLCGPAMQPGAPWPSSGGCANDALLTGAPGPASAPHVLWTTLPSFSDPESASFDGLAIDAEGNVYASGVGFNDAADQLVAIDKSGKVLWNQPSQYGSPAIGKDGTLYACAGTFASLVPAAFSPAGALLWKGTEPTSPLQCAPVILADGTIVFPTTKGLKTSLVAYAPDGTVSWTVDGPSLLQKVASGVTAPLAVGPDGSIYAFDNVQVNCGDVTELVAVSPSHAVAWKVKYAALGDGVTVGADGNVYVAVLLDSLDAYDATGKKLWSQALVNSFGGPALAEDGTLYVTLAADDSPQTGALVALSPTDGSTKWKDTAHCYASSPLVGANGTVYAASSDHLCAWSPTGQLLWSVPVLTNGDSITGIAFGAGATIAAGTHGSGLLLVGE
jgi:outer membrane protein assembly factor BamB